MSVGLTLGTEKLLKEYAHPFMLLTPTHSDESFLRVEFDNKQYSELLTNNFQWHFTHYRFIYLNFNPDQASIFINKFITHKYFTASQPCLVLNNNDNQNEFIIVLGQSEQDMVPQLITDLNKLSTNRFGIFSKSYTSN